MGDEHSKMEWQSRYETTKVDAIVSGGVRLVIYGK